MGQYLKKLPEGEKVEVKGPQGELRYNGLGKFSIHRKNAETNAKYTQNATVKRLGMVAGGSGITPMLQIIRDVVRNPEDKTEMSLIFANVAESVSDCAACSGLAVSQALVRCRVAPPLVSLRCNPEARSFQQQLLTQPQLLWLPFRTFCCARSWTRSRRSTRTSASTTPSTRFGFVIVFECMCMAFPV
jgi:hypothetical protein